jgi:hypothetical protein
MLTEEEHMRIIHAKGGWQKFLELFPHCAPRIKNAYDMAKELYPHEIQVALIKLGLINEYSDSVEENTEPSFETMQPVVKEDKCEGDIF